MLVDRGYVAAVPADNGMIDGINVTTVMLLLLLLLYRLPGYIIYVLMCIEAMCYLYTRI